MPPVTIDDTVRVVAEGTILGQNWVNSFHFQYGTGTPTTTDAQEMADAIEAFYNGFTSSLSNNWSLTLIKVTDINTATGQQWEFAQALTGGVTADTLPPDSSILVSWTSAVRARYARGRTYLAGITESSVDDTGRVVQATIDNIQADVNTLADFASSNNFELAIGSVSQNTSFLVEDGVVKSRVARQRRRNYAA